jgi:multimeric flavodoxin WrbA
MRVLAILGSPRRQGNTEILLDSLIDGARKQGGEVEKLVLCDYNISPCIECGSCSTTGECAIEDDMQDIYPKLLTDDAIVIASPIFFYSVTAVTKAFIDRSQALWARKYLLHQKPLTEKIRCGYFLSLGATKGKQLFEGATLTIKYFFDAIDAKYCGGLFFRGIEGKEDIKHHPSALQEALEMGRKICHKNQSDF